MMRSLIAAAGVFLAVGASAQSVPSHHERQPAGSPRLISAGVLETPGSCVLYQLPVGPPERAIFENYTIGYLLGAGEVWPDRGRGLKIYWDLFAAQTERLCNANPDASWTDVLHAYIHDRKYY
jgi:hypothetical protein